MPGAASNRSRASSQFVRHALGVIILLVLLGHAGGLYRIDVIDRLDAAIYDAMVVRAMPKGVDDRVVIVDIDDKSLAEVGRWPWGRDRMADLLDKLFERGRVALVGFNFVFPEPDESSGLGNLMRLAETELRGEAEFQAALKRLIPRLDHDARFAAAIEGRPVVLGYYLSSRSQDTSAGVLPPPVMPAERLAGARLTHWTSHGGNLPHLQRNALSAGHFNPMLDADGVVRRVPLLVEYGGNCYEALSLAVVRAMLGFPEPLPVLRGGSVESIELVAGDSRLRIPVDENLAALLPFREGPGGFRRVSAADVLADRVQPESLQGRIVLVGTTALGLAELRPTPVSAAFPGVEIHANLIAGMLDGRLKHRPEHLRIAGGALLVVIGLAAIFLLPRLSPLRASAAAGTLFLALVLLHVGLWHFGDLVLPVAGSLTLVSVLYILNMSLGFFVEARTRAQFARLFGQYVPPELVDEMARNPESYSMAGRRQELTMLFADIRGFTSIAEGMPPEQLTGLLNEYLGVMTDVIRRHRGTLDKYVGDAIMAFWGAPVPDDEHAARAVRCALEMQEAARALNERLAARELPPLKMGVGINTGWVTVGDMGSPVRRAYTALGDPVNLAFRLEDLTKAYGVGIIVGERTRDLAERWFLFRELDRVRVRGKENAVTIHEPVAAIEAATDKQREELDAWHRVLQAYRQRDWTEAERRLAELNGKSPRPLHEAFAAQLARCRSMPPAEGWDAVRNFGSE